MLATLIVLAPLFSHLPKAVLGAIIIDAVVFGMIDVRELRRLYRVTRVDFWIAVAAIVGVLSAGVLAGVVVGVVLSLVWLIYVATRPAMPLLGREPDTQRLPRSERESRRPDVRRRRRPAARRRAVLRDCGRAREPHPQPGRRRAELQALVLDLEGVNFVDSQGSAKLAEIHAFLVAGGVTFRVARLKPQVLEVLSADGVVDLIGRDHIHGNVHRAVKAEIA